MERIASEELKKLRESGATIYSFSRLECINRCPYEAYKSYIKKDKQEQNIYALLGGKIHDVLQGITDGKNTEADLLPAVDDELADMDLLGIEFPNENIQKNWEADIRNFASTYKAPKNKGNLLAELEVLYKTPNTHIPLVGYVDLIIENKDKSLSVIDYKSSSLYKGDALIEHARQIILYGLALEQMGYKVKSVAWMFMKYCKIKYQGYKTVKSKKKTDMERVVERKDLGKTLAPIFERELKEQGWDDIDIDFLTDKMIRDNTIDIPGVDLTAARESLQLKVIPYILEAEYTDETKNECVDYIENTVTKWEDMKEYPPKEFYKINSKGNKVEDIFFCTSLCGYRKDCEYLHDYLDQKEKAREGQDDEEEDLFG